jgi:hypothetical protein
MLLRRIGGGPPHTGMDNGCGGALDNDNMEDKMTVQEVEGVIDECQGQPSGRGNGGQQQWDGVCHRHHLRLHLQLHNNGIWMGGTGESVVAFIVNTYKSGVTCFTSCIYIITSPLL